MDAPVIANPPLLDAARAGLGANPKGMSPKWFYDAEGSAIFERITAVPEYYPTRTEAAILSRHAASLAEQVPEGAAFVELGSGASVKTRLILDEGGHFGCYVPIDISEVFLDETATSLRADYPALEIVPLAADFTGPIAFPPALSEMRKAAFFPGSTLGNLTPDGASRLLAGVRAWPGIARFILGVDLVKDPAVLVAAYDDAEGVTAAFNKNLLARMNREIGADFDLDAFAHRAIWNPDAARIEMHLEALSDQTVTLGDATIRFAAGETIHTENSHKYTPEALGDLAAAAGWRVGELLTDEEALFAVVVLDPA